MSEDRERVPRSFVLFATGVAAAGVAILLLTFRAAPFHLTPELALLLLAALLSENFALRLTNFSMSLGFPLAVAAAIIAGPSAAGLAGAVSFTNLSEILARRPVSAFAFNFGQMVLASCACGWAYIGLGGTMLLQDGILVPVSPAQAPAVIWAAVVGGTVLSAVNWGLTIVAVRIARGVPMRRTALAYLQLVPTQLALLFVGILIAQVVASQILALPLFLFPLLLARQVYQRYLAMDGAFVDTVRSLIAALEAKDPYTRGHSERVAGYAVALGERVGLDERSLETLEKAALLHDIGKLGLSSALLAKPSRLTDEEFAAILKHPGDGAGMIDRIRPLRGLVEYVRYHHEKFDGTGYPSKIAGTDIPQFSRVLAVADAFDAMTTNRAYRAAMSHEDAVDELLRCAGTQFDPELVEAFVSGRLGVPAPPDGAEYHDSAQEVGASSQ